MRGGASVRVNLTIPAELDAVLVELARLTGRGKASFASEALCWYLPELRGLAEKLRPRTGQESLQSVADPEAMVAAAEGALGVKLSRDERRRIIREIRQAGGRPGP